MYLILKAPCPAGSNLPQKINFLGDFFGELYLREYLELWAQIFTEFQSLPETFKNEVFLLTSRAEKIQKNTNIPQAEFYPEILANSCKFIKKTLSKWFYLQIVYFIMEIPSQIYKHLC